MNALKIFSFFFILLFNYADLASARTPGDELNFLRDNISVQTTDYPEFQEERKQNEGGDKDKDEGKEKDDDKDDKEDNEGKDKDDKEDKEGSEKGGGEKGKDEEKGDDKEDKDDEGDRDKGKDDKEDKDNDDDKEDKDKKPANTAPEAHAGEDWELEDADGDGKESVKLDGSKSKDNDGQIVSYSWSIEGAATELATGVSPTVSLPVGDTWIVLTVTDDGGLTATDNVKIKIKEAKEEDKDKEDDKGDDKNDNDEKGEGDKDEKEDKDQDEDKEDKDEKEENDEDEPANIAPEINPGEDQELTDADGDGKETVVLDASGTIDVDGSISSYIWTVNGEEIARGVNPAVELPVGTTTIVLTVTDDKGLTVSEEVKVTINEEEKEELPENKAPKAHAGENQELTDADGDGVESVTLDGSKSKDNDGQIVSYSWSIEGASTELATGVSPTVSLPIGDTWIILTVTDNGGLTASEKVKIKIKEGKEEDKDKDNDNGNDKDEEGDKEDGGDDDGNDEGDKDNRGNDGDEDENENPANIAPEAHAGEDQVLTDADGDGTEVVILDASGSKDTDGTISSYRWLLAGTETEVATGVNPGVPLGVGIHTLVLIVTDEEGLTAMDEITITIKEESREEDDESEDEEEEEEPANTAPVAHAGVDQQLTDRDRDGTEAVVLNGSGSVDEDGQIITYSWSIEGSETELATGVNPTVGLPVGNTTIILTITDDGGLTASDEVIISIKEGSELVNEDENDEGEEQEDEEEDQGENTDEGGGETGTAWLPNLFSPNGDSMNDTFTLEGTHVEKVHFRIYNRQGRLVYETMDVEEATLSGWDGRAFGEDQPEGSYVWILEGSYEDGSPILIDGKIKGIVTIIR